MISIILDGAGFHDIQGFFSQAELLLTGKQEGLGHSLSGFEDLLRGGFGLHASGEELHIIWIHAAMSRKALGYEHAEQFYASLLNKCHPSNVNNLKKKLDAACRHEGPTLFDTICSIILDSEDTGHNCTLTVIE